MTDFSPGTQITHEDFVIFSITLRLQLSVTAKTLKRYITEAYKAIQAAGHNITPQNMRNIFNYSKSPDTKREEMPTWVRLLRNTVATLAKGAGISNSTGYGSDYDNLDSFHVTQKSRNISPGQLAVG